MEGNGWMWKNIYSLESGCVAHDDTTQGESAYCVFLYVLTLSHGRAGNGTRPVIILLYIC